MKMWNFVVRCSPLAVFVLIATLMAPLPGWAMPGDDPGFVQFRGASFPVKEDAGSVTVLVRRHRGDDGAVSVAYETLAGSATPAEDYLDTAGILEWEDGDRDDKEIVIGILDDDISEGPETFGVRLFDPTDSLEIGALSGTLVRIKPSDQDGGGGGDDDDFGVIRLTSVSFPAFEVSEEAVFTVERVEGTDGAVSVDYTTVDGSALAGSDYITTSGTLSWGDGEGGIKEVTVPLIDDVEPEDLETISVVLTNATGGATLGDRDVASIIIIDDDGGAGACVPDDETLCLRNGRFQVTGTWTDFNGGQGPFHMIPASDETGLVWFFKPSNLELLVKVLRGCPVNGHYWVFFAATTNVGFTMEVIDLETGVTRTYLNPVGVSPESVTDTTAFATCP